MAAAAEAAAVVVTETAAAVVTETAVVTIAMETEVEVVALVAPVGARTGARIGEVEVATGVLGTTVRHMIMSAGNANS